MAKGPSASLVQVLVALGGGALAFFAVAFASSRQAMLPGVVVAAVPVACLLSALVASRITARSCQGGPGVLEVAGLYRSQGKSWRLVMEVEPGIVYLSGAGFPEATWKGHEVAPDPQDRYRVLLGEDATFVCPSEAAATAVVALTALAGSTEGERDVR